MRIDRLLCFLRFAKTRGIAANLVMTGQLRRNGERVTRASQDIVVGDVLTIPLGMSVRLVEILALPERRGPPREAQSCYRALDPQGKSAIAREPEPGATPAEDEGNASQ